MYAFTVSIFEARPRAVALKVVWGEPSYTNKELARRLEAQGCSGTRQLRALIIVNRQHQDAIPGCPVAMSRAVPSRVSAAGGSRGAMLGRAVGIQPPFPQMGLF
jgi:hypothetical protein